MSRKSLLPQHRRHVHIYDEDWEYLTQLIERHYGKKADEITGVSSAIRLIIHTKVQQLKAEEQRAIDNNTRTVNNTYTTGK